MNSGEHLEDNSRKFLTKNINVLWSTSVLWYETYIGGKETISHNRALTKLFTVECTQRWPKQ